MQDEVYNLAEAIPGPSEKRVEKIASEHGVHIVFGMPEESEVKGVIHNTALLVGPKGLVGKYRKIHLPTHTVFEERRYYRPGQAAPVFETRFGKIGLTICYDLYFPELTRLEALEGAELIVCISASPGLRRRFFEGFCLSVAPNGSVLVQCKYDEEDFQPCKVDLAEVSRARAFIPTIKDLDPQLFDQLRTKSREA